MSADDPILEFLKKVALGESFNNEVPDLSLRVSAAKSCLPYTSVRIKTGGDEQSILDKWAVENADMLFPL